MVGLLLHDHPMEQSSEGAREQGVPHADLQIEYQIMLAEYSALRTEIDRRANVQWNVYALQLASAGAISSLAISAASNVALLLIIPLSSYMLGSRYIFHDFHIKLIHRYVRESLSGRLRGKLEWEHWKKREFSEVGDRPWFRVAGWNVAHPTRLAFQGVAILTLVAVLFSAANTWWARQPHWSLILGFVVIWILGAVVTFLLHRSFNRSVNE